MSIPNPLATLARWSLRSAMPLVMLLATPTVAQEVAIRQVGADGRYETQLDPKAAVPPFSSGSVAGFRSRVDRLTALLAAMPETSMPPGTVCHRLKSWIEITPPHRVLAAEVGVMSPISFTNGRCHRMTGTGVVFRINSLSLLLDPQQAYVRAGPDHGDWWLLPQGVADGREIDLNDRVAFTHGRAPLLVPVSAGRYLRTRIDALPVGPEGGAAGDLERWLNGGKAKMQAENETQLNDMKAYLKPGDLAKMAEAMAVVVSSTEKELRRAASAPQTPNERDQLSRQLAQMTAAQKAAPACMSLQTGQVDASGDCPEGYILYELNPVYFNTAKPDAIQLIVVETPKGRTHGESDERLKARQALWNALDRRAIAALVD